MKYRWFNQVLTRHSGIFTVHCVDKEQAEFNVTRFYNNRIIKKHTMKFESREKADNITLMDDIVGIFVCDAELMADIHYHEMKEHTEIHRDVDFSQERDEDN